MRRSGPGGRGSGRPRPAGRAERLPSRSDAVSGSGAGADRNKNKKKRKSKAERRAARASRSSTGFLVLAGAIGAAVIGLAFRAFASAKKGKRMLQDAAKRPLHFTEHARCRMECRHISPSQVRAALATGRVNLLKSDLDGSDKACPKLVVDAAVPGSFGGETKHVQAVISACPADTNVVTVIDTDRDWECHCPGDD